MATEREETATRILTSATKLFARKGYDGTSTKEICETAGVNIAAIHYHFESKENLYRQIIERFASDRLEFARKTLQDPESLEDLKVRLEIFLKETVETFLDQRDLVTLIQREMEMHEAGKVHEGFQKTMFNHMRTLVNFLDHARKNGILGAEIDPFPAAISLFVPVVQSVRMEPLMKKNLGHSISEPEFRNRWIQQTVRTFLFGATRRSST